MEAKARLKGKATKEKEPERYCGIYQSLKESLKEVKLYKEGKIHLDTWNEFLKKLKEEKE